MSESMTMQDHIKEELIEQLAAVEKYNEILRDGFFQQALCASLTGLRSATQLTDKGVALIPRKDLIETALKDAQEAVRQVGELNKEKAECTLPENP